MNLNGYTFRYTASLARVASIMDLMQASPRTRAELAAATSIGINAMGRYLAALKAEDKIHIAAWRQNCPGSPSPVYAAGPGKDKRKPRPMTEAQKQKRSRENNPERVIRDTQLKRQARSKLQRDPLTAALFGAAA